MVGTVINLLDRKRFEYSYLPGSATQSVVLIPLIEACDYGYIALYARVHARSMSAGQSFMFSLFNILPSDEDSREFIERDGTGAPLSFADLSITSAMPTAVPGMYSAISTSGGPCLKLTLKAIQTSSPATFYAEISLLLHMRDSR